MEEPAQTDPRNKRLHPILLRRIHLPAPGPPRQRDPSWWRRQLPPPPPPASVGRKRIAGERTVPGQGAVCGWEALDPRTPAPGSGLRPGSWNSHRPRLQPGGSAEEGGRALLWGKGYEGHRPGLVARRVVPASETGHPRAGGGSAKRGAEATENGHVFRDPGAPRPGCPPPRSPGQPRRSVPTAWSLTLIVPSIWPSLQPSPPIFHTLTRLQPDLAAPSD